MATAMTTPMQISGQISGAGKRNHLTDVAGLLVGNAENARLKSGVSVVTSRLPFACSVAVMGGAPGTRETDLLSPVSLVEKVDALVLAGGSVYGLEAASGVVAGLAKAGHGMEVVAKVPKVPRVPKVPIVPAAILFDLANGGDKNWQANPYAELGRVALEAASDNCNLGSFGVGAGAVCAECKGGLGAASLVLAGEAGEEIMVAALVAANPFGAVLCANSKRFWAGGCEVGDEFGGWGVPHKANPLAVVTKTMRGAMAGAEAEAGARQRGGGGNTIIGVVATDLDLDKAGLRRLALMAHAGIARAVRPAHTPLDGDVLFAVSTGAKKLARAGGEAEEDRGLARGAGLAMVGHAGALCVSRAIGRGVYLATASEGDVLPTAREIVGG